MLERDKIESQLQAVLDDPPEKGFPADAQRLVDRIKRHWDEWFTFLSHPEVTRYLRAQNYQFKIQN